MWEDFGVYVFNVCSTLVVLVVAPLLYKELTMGVCRSKKRLDGKVIIITGGNAGIGLETAKDLAKRGAEIVIASRNLTKTQKVVDMIKKETSNDKIHAKVLDLSLQKEVKRFAREILNQFPKIHFLINNAGLSGDIAERFFPNPKVKQGRELTKEGHELRMATNFLGPTTLTELLLERIKESGSPNDVSRVIHVSSMGNVLSKINPEDLDLMAVRQSPFDVNLQYCNSKVMQLHYNCHLARELAHSNTESVALHPGAVRTDIFRDVSALGKLLMIDPMLWLLGKNPRQGAQTSIFCVVSEDKLNGKYLMDCRPAWLVHPSVGDEQREVIMINQVKRLLNLNTSS